jgi:hypothetical protein
MRRDLFKTYQAAEIIKIYQIHQATPFPTIPFIPVLDYQFLNGVKISQSRKDKFLLLS